MKKKISEKDLKTWNSFIKKIGKIEDKDEAIYPKEKKIITKAQIDLHGLSFSKASIKVLHFINDSYDKGIREIKVITGKGLRSKSDKNPYQSKKLSTLKNFIPYVIENDEVKKKIIKIKKAQLNDGGSGAFYILLKNKFR